MTSVTSCNTATSSNVAPISIILIIVITAIVTALITVLLATVTSVLIHIFISKKHNSRILPGGGGGETELAPPTGPEEEEYEEVDRDREGAAGSDPTEDPTYMNIGGGRIMLELTKNKAYGGVFSATCSQN